MGIPSYFRKIVKEYPNVTFWDSEKSIDHFFIDFNAMIYNVIPQIKNTETMTAFEFENVLLTKTLEQMERVITKIVKPAKSVIVAMDGPPPRAKMIQQRHRRYKGIKEAEFHAHLETKYKRNIKRLNWNRSAISPGTVFMQRLSNRIVENIKKGSMGTNIEITFSDSSVPGEGEHKILPYIHALKDTNDTIAVYSPDADMIVLSMITHKNNVFIFKEDEFEKSKNEFLYLSIDQCRQGFISELYERYEPVKLNGTKMTEIEISDSFLIDYSFLTFLCGNDFIVANPFLKMKEGGMESLLKIYNTIFEGEFLILKNVKSGKYTKINLDFFKKLIMGLAEIELKMLQDTQRKRDRIRRGNNSKNSNNSQKDSEDKNREPWKDEESRFQHEYYYSPMHPQFETYNKQFNKLDYYKDDWKQRYNNHFFELGNETKPTIDEVCRQYLKSLVFCLGYYLDEIPSWEYFYPYRASPTFCDFSNWLNEKNEIPQFIFEKGRPFTQFEQLLLVLPKLSFGLLPKQLRILPSKLEHDSYPRKFELDILLGGKYIYSEPVLPEIDIEEVRKFVESGDYSDMEIVRNTVTSEPLKVTVSGSKPKRVRKEFKKKIIAGN